MLGNGRAADTFEYIFALFGLFTQPLVWLGHLIIHRSDSLSAFVWRPEIKIHPPDVYDRKIPG
jgi:hypothetical protein